MQNQGIVPTHQILDNQCSGRELCQEVDWNFQGSLHWSPEGLATSMPMQLWYQLLPQVEQQLLLLRQSQVNRGMSANAHVYQGQHDYNKHPCVPIGMESLVHVKPHKLHTYAQHHNKRYVIGTLFEHYHCQKIWMKDTHATQVSGAAWFKHKYLTNPSVIPEDRIVAAIGGPMKTLTTGGALQLRDDTADKLWKLQEILDPRKDKTDKRKVMAPTQQTPVTQPVTQQSSTGGKQQPQPSSSSKGGTEICQPSKGAQKDG
jgi:hypothetical protein